MFGRAHNGRRDARLDPRQERATVGWEGAAVATGRRIEHEGRKVPNIGLGGVAAGVPRP